jgi:hypothetical protein
MLHALGHLLVSASNNYATRFWALAPVFVPDGAKPVPGRPDDDAYGEQDDEDGTLAVLSSFGGSASVADSRACRTPPTDTSGGAHGGVGLGMDDVVPEFGDGLGGGSTNVPVGQ